jgi:hypothetical protein
LAILAIIWRMYSVPKGRQRGKKPQERRIKGAKQENKINK